MPEYASRGPSAIPAITTPTAAAPRAAQNHQRWAIEPRVRFARSDAAAGEGRADVETAAGTASGGGAGGMACAMKIGSGVAGTAPGGASPSMMGAVVVAGALCAGAAADTKPISVSAIDPNARMTRI